MADLSAPRPDMLSAKDRKKLEKAQKKLEKAKEKWKLYVDYLLRHLTITTSKYMKWEKTEFELFKEAVEKAQRLDDKDQKDATCLNKLKQRHDVLETKKYFSECSMIQKYMDFVARLRGLNLIAKDFAKILKKAKLEPVDEMNKLFEFWKTFLGLKCDISTLEPNDVDKTHPGMKYVMWICLIRTMLHLGNQFLKASSALCDVPLVAIDQFVGFNLSDEQMSICERLEEQFKTVKDTGKKLPSLSSKLGQGAAKPKPEDETDASKRIPGETNHLTFELPAEPGMIATVGGGKGKKGKKK